MHELYTIKTNRQDMPEHKLTKGNDFIKGIKDLGNLLGYHVEFESPVSPEKEISPAVDIAWYKEENQKFPLFIFEIESSASNGMVYNPLKVFSKKNEQFEKPLFFFQIVLRGGQDSSRIEDLKNQFGNYNYRIYRTAELEEKKLILDILDQHRRLTQELDIINLANYLVAAKWIDIDIEQVSNHIVSLEFEKNSGDLLSSFVVLSSIDKSFIPITLNLLENIHIDFFSNLNRVNYKTYLGNSWCFPIHLGMIYSNIDDLYKREKIINQLQYWQEKNSYMTMIGPHFGLSHDYDEFLIWGSGGLFGLLSYLFYDNDEIRTYFAKELFKIIDKSKAEYKLSNLLWILHIIPISEKGKKLFHKAKTEFKSIGCFSIDSFRIPPFFNADEEWLEEIAEKNDSFPEFNELKKFAKPKEEIVGFERFSVASKFLSSDYISDEMIKEITAYNRIDSQ